MSILNIEYYSPTTFLNTTANTQIAPATSCVGWQYVKWQSKETKIGERGAQWLAEV
jgi:hypothetical protein